MHKAQIESIMDVIDSISSNFEDLVLGDLVLGDLVLGDSVQRIWVEKLTSTILPELILLCSGLDSGVTDTEIAETLKSQFNVSYDCCLKLAIQIHKQISL